MVIYLLRMFGISLVLTIVIELAVAVFIKISLTRRNIQLILLVNCLTNPAAVLTVWICSLLFGSKVVFFFQIPVEAVVVFVEARVYGYFAKDVNWNIRQPVKLAVVANGLSWLTGVLLQVLLR